MSLQRFDEVSGMLKRWNAAENAGTQHLGPGRSWQKAVCRIRIGGCDSENVVCVNLWVEIPKEVSETTVS